jgi:hypothetical protein
MRTSERIFIISHWFIYAPINHGASAFVIPSTSGTVVGNIDKTTLSRKVGLRAFTTEHYLDSLAEPSALPFNSGVNVASGEYLKTLSHIVQSSGGFDVSDMNMDMNQMYHSQTPPEEFLNRLSYNLAQVSMDSEVLDESASSTVSTFFVSGSSSSSMTSTTSQVGGSYSSVEPLLSTSYSTLDTISSNSIPDSPLTFQGNSIVEQMGQLAIAAEEDVADKIQPIDDTSSNIDKAIESLEQRREMIQKQLAQLKSPDATTPADPPVSEITSTLPPSIEPATSAPIVNTNVDDTSINAVQDSVSELSKSLKAMLSEESYSSPSTSFSFEKATGGSLSDSFKSILKTQPYKAPSPTSSTSFSIKDIRTPKVMEPKAPNLDTKTVQEFLNDVSQKVNDAGESTLKAITDAIQAQQVIVNEGTSGSMKVISDTTSNTVKTIGEASISDVAASVVSGIKFIAVLMLKLIDLILVKVGEPTVAQMMKSVQTSIQTVVDGATSAVVHTVTDIGNLTVKDILQGLISLLITVSKLLLTVFNMLVKYLSGKGASEWVLEASTLLNEQSKALINKASHTAYDLTHASFTELAASIGAFSQEIGSHLVSSIDVTSDSILTTGLLGI